MLLQYAKRNVEVYESIEDLMDDVQRKVSPDVKLENTRNLYFYFVGFLLFVCLAFVVDIFWFKQLQTIHRKLAGYSVMLVQITKLRQFRAAFLVKKTYKRQKFRSPIIRTDCIFDQALTMIPIQEK